MVSQFMTSSIASSRHMMLSENLFVYTICDAWKDFIILGQQTDLTANSLMLDLAESLLNIHVEDNSCMQHMDGGYVKSVHLYFCIVSLYLRSNSSTISSLWQRHDIQHKNYCWLENYKAQSINKKLKFHKKTEVSKFHLQFLWKPTPFYGQKKMKWP
jgi:hypothetical protein